MRKIEHIGIAVKDLEKSNDLFSALLGELPYKTEEVKSESVTTSFFRSGPNKIELVAASNEQSPIAKFIDKRGEGIHHIALQVDSVEAALEQAKENGLKLIDETPRIGAHRTKIAFIHPKSTNGVLFEFIEATE